MNSSDGQTHVLVEERVVPNLAKEHPSAQGWTARKRFFRDNASGARGVVATSLKSCSNSDPPWILPSPQRTAIRRLPVF